MPETVINLTTTDHATEPVQVPRGTNSLSASIQIDDDNFTWSSAVVTLQWNLDPLYEAGWAALPTTVTWTAADKSQPAVPVANLGYIRWKPTTAEDTDPHARIVYQFG